MSTDTYRIEEARIRQYLPMFLANETPIHFKYRSTTDVLTVLAGNQDRWTTSSANAGNCRVYFDSVGAPVRVEIPTATRLFSRNWLTRHERGRGVRWRLRLGLP